MFKSIVVSFLAVSAFSCKQRFDDSNAKDLVQPSRSSADSKRERECTVNTATESELTDIQSFSGTGVMEKRKDVKIFLVFFKTNGIRSDEMYGCIEITAEGNVIFGGAALCQKENAKPIKCYSGRGKGLVALKKTYHENWPRKQLGEVLGNPNFGQDLDFAFFKGAGILKQSFDQSIEVLTGINFRKD